MHARLRGRTVGVQHAMNDQLAAIIRWALCLWGSAFCTLFLLGLKWDDFDTALYHRRLHASLEAPVLAGHLAVQMMLVMSGILHGVKLFSQHGNDDIVAADLLPVQARLWKHLTLRWTLRRVRSLVGRLWVPLLLVLFIAFGVQSKQAAGQFQEATAESLISAIFLRGGEGRFDAQLAPWTWPISHALSFGLTLHCGVYALVSAARVTAAVSALLHSITMESCGLGPERPRPRRRSERVEWATVAEDMSRALRACARTVVRAIPNPTTIMLRISMLIFNTLHISLLLCIGGVWAWGVYQRIMWSPILGAMSVRYTPMAVSAPFYDYVFTPAWMSAPSYAAGVWCSYWIASAPRSISTSISQGFLGASAALVVLSFSAYDITYWITDLPTEGKRFALALYIPLYGLCAAYSVSVALRSPTLMSILNTGYTGEIGSWAVHTKHVTLWVTLLQPLIGYGILSGMKVGSNPYPGTVTGYTILTVLATLPLAWMITALHITVLNACTAVLRSEAVKKPFTLLQEACLRRYPLLAPLIRGRRRTVLNEDEEDVPPPAVLVQDAWVMGGKWRDRLRRFVRLRVNNYGPYPPDLVRAAGSGSGSATWDSPEQRVGMVSAYILTRLAQEAEASNNAKPASSADVVDSTLSVVTAVRSGAVSALTAAHALWSRRSGEVVDTTADTQQQQAHVQGPDGRNIARMNWSRFRSLPPPPIPPVRILSSAGTFSEEAEGADAEGEQEDGATLPAYTRELAQWYTAAAAALAQEWAVAAKADDTTLVLLMQRLGDDIAAILQGTMGGEEGDDRSGSEEGEEDEEPADNDQVELQEAYQRDGLVRRGPPAGPYASSSSSTPGSLPTSFPPQQPQSEDSWAAEESEAQCSTAEELGLLSSDAASYATAHSSSGAKGPPAGPVAGMPRRPPAGPQ